MTHYLFITYCVSDKPGPAMIGVYKRGLRIALEIVRRGHDVTFFCSGRENYQDDLTHQAQSQMDFLDIPWDWDPVRRRDRQLEILKRIAPDVIVIGEAPLAGPLLEITQSAAELKIPTVCLDNAYQPLLSKMFCYRFSGVYDQIILNGLSSQYVVRPRDYLKQIPPLITYPENHANANEEYILVIAYDLKVAKLAIKILNSLNKIDFRAIFIGTKRKITPLLEKLPEKSRDFCSIIKPPSENEYFSLLKGAKIAITKLGFMQVTEALSLKTPIIALYYPGYFLLESLPESLRKFIHAVENPEDPSISSVFRKFLETDPKLLDGLHDGKFNGIHRAADCLEEKIVFNNRISHLSKLGFGLGILKKAIKKFENQPVTIESIRGFYLRSLHEQIIYSIICHYQVDEENKVVRLLGHQYRTIGAMKHDLAKNINRTVLIKSFLKKHLIEIDHLNYEMPTVQECLELGEIYIPRRGRLNQLIRREIRAYLKQR